MKPIINPLALFLAIVCVACACVTPPDQISTTKKEFIDSLYRESFTFLHSDSSKVFELAASVEHHSTTSGYDQGLANANYIRGYVYGFNHQYDLAVAHLIASLKISKRIDHYELTVGTLENIARIYYLTQNSSRAMEYYKDALSFAKIRNDETRLAKYKFYIARCLDMLGSHDLSREYFNYSAADYLNLQDFENLARVQLCLGNSYWTTENSDSAQYFYNIALQSGPGLQNEHEIMGNGLNNIGNMHLSQKNYNVAEDYFLRALAIAELPSSTKKTINNNLAEIYQEQKNWQKAARYYAKVADQKTNQIFDRQYTKATKGLYEIYKQAANHEMAYRYGDRLAENMLPLIEMKEKLELHNQQYRLHEAEERIRLVEAKAAAFRQWVINISIISLLSIISLIGLFLFFKQHRKWRSLRNSIDGIYREHWQLYNEAIEAIAEVSLPQPATFKGE